MHMAAMTSFREKRARAVYVMMSLIDTVYALIIIKSSQDKLPLIKNN